MNMFDEIIKRLKINETDAKNIRKIVNDEKDLTDILFSIDKYFLLKNKNE